jgi:hypothetical protein
VADDEAGAARARADRRVADAFRRSLVSQRRRSPCPASPPRPGFFLNRQDEAHRIVQAIGAPNLKVQMDLYAGLGLRPALRKR